MNAPASMSRVASPKVVPHAPRFDYTLVLVHGTRGFKHASGELHFTGVWQSNQVDGGPVKGRLSAWLTH